MSKRPRLVEEPGLTKKFCELFEMGVTIAAACLELDVPLQCFKDWRRWGSIVREDGNEAKEPYKSFAQKVNRSLALFENSLVSEIRRQGRDARYASDVEIDERDDDGKVVGKTVLHKKGDIILNPKGYVARPGHWQANAYLLGVRFPKKYSPQVRVIVQEQLDAALRALERGLEPETYARVLDILANADGSEGDADPLGPGAPPPGKAAAKERRASTRH